MQQTKPMTAYQKRRRVHQVSIFHINSNLSHQDKRSPINDGPMSRSSTVLNPFSPVPTNAITKPMAIVPKPTYRKAFANELGPLNAPRKSSSSDEPPSDES